MSEATTGERGWRPLREAAQRMAQQAPNRAAGIAALLREQIPDYALVPVGDLVPGVTASVVSGMSALAERRGPTAAELDQIRWVAESRARQGILLASVIRAYHLGTGSAWEELSRDARHRGADEAAILEAAQLMWRWSDQVSVHAAVAHQQAGMDIVRHDQQRRTEFLRAVLFGSASPAELRAQAAGYRLAADRPYLPFQAEVPIGTDPLDVERLISRAGSTPEQPALVGLIEGSLSGVLARIPDLGRLPVTVVLGPPADLAGVPASFLLACRALRAAVGFALPGVHRVEDLALHVAVASEEFLGACLSRRYLEPLRSLRSSAGEVERTLEEFLAAGLRVDEAARAGFVHPNTVRHRLRRFEQVTGADLHRVQDVVGLWWALQHRRLTASGGPGAGAPREP